MFLTLVLSKIVGANEVAVEVPEGATTEHVLESLAEMFPALRDELQSTAVAVNLNYITEPVPVRVTDAVAILPPISGG